MISLFIVKCRPPSYQENITVSGYALPALENTEISLSCPPGYRFPDGEDATVMSTCTSEAEWWPDLSQLECHRRFLQ